MKPLLRERKVYTVHQSAKSPRAKWAEALGLTGYHEIGIQNVGAYQWEVGKNHTNKYKNHNSMKSIDLLARGGRVNGVVDLHGLSCSIVRLLVFPKRNPDLLVDTLEHALRR